MEVMVTNIHAIDLEALAVLPGVANLQVAEPRGAVKGALLLLAVETVDILPARVVAILSLDALMREVIEVRAELCLEHVIVDVDHVAVHDTHEVLSAHIEDVVACGVVLVHLHAASLEQIGDVVLTEECRCYFEASSTAESSRNIVNSNDGVTDDYMVLSEHLRGDVVKMDDLTWADLGLKDVDAGSKEELVHLLDLLTSSKNALVPPEVLEVISADPFTRALVLVSKGRHEARSVW